MIPAPEHYILLSIVLFAIGSLGVLIRRDMITIFICIELMLSAANLAFITFSRLHGDHQGHLFVLFIVGVAAAEAAVGLSLIILLKRRFGQVFVASVNQLKG